VNKRKPFSKYYIGILKEWQRSNMKYNTYCVRNTSKIACIQETHHHSDHCFTIWAYCHEWENTKVWIDDTDHENLPPTVEKVKT